MPSVNDPHADAASPVETSLDLLRQAQAGDAEALNALIARYLPRLRRWATGRLPAHARGMTDTQDLVQETVSRAFKKIEGFEVRGEGALQAYLRQVLLNEIRQEIRRAGRRPPPSGADDLQAAAEIASPAPSPLEMAIGADALARYDDALGRLKAGDREAIVARIELGLSYQEVAEATGKPSANAARMAVERALLRLLEEMGRSGQSVVARSDGRASGSA
jgi:RNA polymerase sigma-70 factor (ECF subfamily)